MAGAKYSLEPQQVPLVETRWRRICTPIPVPESLPVLEQLQAYEPVSMQGQPPIVWDRAEGCSVYDAWGNRWIDWSSGVLVTNAGHAREEVVEAIVRQARHPLHHNYCFPSALRAELAQRLVAKAPAGLDKVFLLTTGSEATENAIKLARTHGESVGGPRKVVFVTFANAFHGRTLGSQQAGGTPALKEWIVNLDPGFVQVPFPDPYRVADCSFDGFRRALAEQGIDEDDVCGVMSESYQGGDASFLPVEYARALRDWCTAKQALLVMDEVQAGFGRTGKFWTFEHYGIVPDLICCGKGISSGLPLAAVIGRTEIMNQYPPGSMTSTHTGNPICCAAAIASLDLIEGEGLVEHAAAMGALLHSRLAELQVAHPDVIGAVHGKGLVAGVQMVKPGTKDPDGDLALTIVRKSMEKGLLMFSPVGLGGGTVKIAPPLCTPEDAIAEGCDVLAEAVAEAV